MRGKRLLSESANLKSVNRMQGDTQQDFGSIIREYRLRAGYDTKELGEALGLSRSAIQNWEGGQRRPNIDVIPALCAVLKMPLSILFSMPSEKELPNDETNLLVTYRNLSVHGKRAAFKMIDSLQESEYRNRCIAMHDKFLRRPANSLPASAGIGYSLDTEAEHEMLFIRTCSEAYDADELIRVSGDSMEPTFFDGDLLFVEHNSDLQPGDIGIFVFDGEGYVKEYQPDGLHSHNPKYGILHPTASDSFRCIGKVLGAVSEELFPTKDEMAMLTAAMDEVYE